MHIVKRTNIPICNVKGDLEYVYIVYNEVTTIVQAQEYCEVRVSEASKNSETIAENVQTLSDNALRASEGIAQISQAMESLSSAVEEITSNMESVSGISKETNELSKNGTFLARQAKTCMGEIGASSDNVYKIVADVEKQMTGMSKIVIAIRGVANQTNLLALNAAIEAARAGDAGRGFAVVAAEVKSLAQESGNSAKQIEEMIGLLRKSTIKATEAMGDAKSMVRNGEKVVGEMLGAFDKIMLAVEKLAHSALEVAAATQEQSATTEEVAANVREVVALIEKTSAEANEALIATRNSTAALNKIAGTIRSLRNAESENSKG
jgi:methyl-accepting chemotaxis protein